MGEPEEGQEGCVSPELDADRDLGLAGNGSVELLHDLSGEGRPRDGTDLLGRVISKVVLMVIGQSSELVNGVFREEIFGLDAGVMDKSNVDQVKDYPNQQCVPWRVGDFAYQCRHS